jgi:hypothetical protein
MKASHGIIALLLLAVTWTPVAPARADADDNHGHDALEQTLREVAEKGFAAYSSRNVQETLRYIHTKSPAYQRTMDELQEQFAATESRLELLDFHFVGHDDEFAVARYRLKTEAPQDPNFQANVIDAIVLFYQESGVWKWWSDHILGVELL